MASVFSQIIAGDLPGKFVWSDDRCVAFLSINPLRDGHVLVVPREEVEHWLDLDPELLHHLTDAAQTIGKALQAAYQPAKVGMMLAGLEVPHVHLHLVPIDDLNDMDFANADPDPGDERLERAAEQVRGALRDLGVRQVAEA